MSRKSFASPSKKIHQDTLEKLIGLGPRSMQKSYYPELKARLDELTRFKNLLDNVNDLIILIDIPSGLIIDVNQTTASLLGFTSEEILGRSLSHLMNRGEAERVYGFFSQDKISSRLIQTTLITAQNQGVPVEINCKIVRMEPDGFGVLIARNISDREKARQEIELQRTFFRQLFENSPKATVMLDGDFQIVEINQSFSSLFGYAKMEIYGTSISKCITPEKLVHEDAALQDNLLAGQSMGMETKRCAKDGRMIDVELLCIPVSFEGKFRGAFYIFSDLTEKRKAEQIMIQQQKLESIGLLAGGIAHDFNNLLHAMGGNLQQLDMKIPEGHPGKERIGTIQKSIDRAAKLVRQMLLYSRKAETHMQSLDLNREIRFAANLLERSIPKMISIELDLDRETRTIKADPVQMEQVLLNLGKNAADAMPGGGRLHIQTRNTVLDQNYVKTHQGAKPGEYVLMTVTDTGCGIDKETLEQIFNPFFTTKEVGKGTGLGLASVYGIVKAHEGYIMCYSEPGQGTAFKIYLPAAQQENADHAEKEEQESVSQEGTETILVVDDDDEIRELTTEILEDSGYQVLGTASGEQALELFKDQAAKVDLVLMDLNMPGMGGGQCTRKMIEINPQAKVLVTSGYPASGHGREASELGAKDFISKPFQTKELLTRIREVLERE